MLQIAAYANYLDFGLQTAVARYVAQAVELKDDVRRDRLVSTALSLLAGAGLAAFVMIAAVALEAPRIFRHVPADLMGDLRGGVVMLGAGAALVLPLSAFTGVLVGLHRNEYPALAIGGTRLAGAVAVTLASRYTESLVWLAVCLAVPNLIGGLLQAGIAKALLPGMRLRRGGIDRTMAAELVKYCSVLSVWSFGMLLVSGLDVTIVGYFRFAAVGYYSIATTLVTFFTGVSGSAFAALLTPLAVLQARGEYGRIRDLVVSSTRLNTYATMAVTVRSFFLGEWALRLWGGAGQCVANSLMILERDPASGEYERDGGQCVRNNAGGDGNAELPACRRSWWRERSIWCWSVAGIPGIGPSGVAWATLAGGVVAMCMQVLLVMRRVTEIEWIGRALYARGLYSRSRRFSR